MSITLQTIESLPFVSETTESTTLVGWDGKRTVRVAKDAFGGDGLPTGGEPHQMLVTDADGNTVWEDRLCYETIEMQTIVDNSTTLTLATSFGDTNIYIVGTTSEPVVYNPMPIVGSNCIVNFNGNVYEGVLTPIPVELESIYPGAFIVGNPNVLGQLMGVDINDTGEPFLLLFVRDEEFVDGHALSVVSNVELETINIDMEMSNVIAIDSKFLPTIQAKNLPNDIPVTKITGLSKVATSGQMKDLSGEVPDLGVRSELANCVSYYHITSPSDYPTVTYNDKTYYDLGQLHSEYEYATLCYVKIGSTGFARDEHGTRNVTFIDGYDGYIFRSALILTKKGGSAPDGLSPGHLYVREDFTIKYTSLRNSTLMIYYVNFNSGRLFVDKNKRRAFSVVGDCCVPTVVNPDTEEIVWEASHSTRGELNVIWEGDTEGRDTFTIGSYVYYKVSDIVPSHESINSIQANFSDNTTMTESNVTFNVALGYWYKFVELGDSILFVIASGTYTPLAGTTGVAFTAPSRGIYFLYDEIKRVTQLKMDCDIPNSVMRLNSASGKKFNITVSDDGILTANEVIE